MLITSSFYYRTNKSNQYGTTENMEIHTTSFVKNETTAPSSLYHPALKIITRNINHISLPSLHERRTNLCTNYFNKLKNENHVLHELLPEKVNHSYNTRFKHQLTPSWLSPPVCHALYLVHRFHSIIGCFHG